MRQPPLPIRLLSALGLALALGAGLLAASSAAAQAPGARLKPGNAAEGWWGRTSLGLAVERTEYRPGCGAAPGGCEAPSLVGRASYNDSFSLFGRLGAGAPRTFALGADHGYGLSYGAGLSWEFSPRLSATIAWDAYDLGSGAPLRSTNLGLRWRY